MNVQTIVLGNILAIAPADTLQLVIIAGVSLAILTAKWKDLMVTFFDENHARSIGLRPGHCGFCSSRCSRLHRRGLADGRRFPGHRDGGYPPAPPLTS